MSDLLFQDHDVLMLYRAGLDGIEGDELTAGSSLHPRDWFTLFQPC